MYHTIVVRWADPEDEGAATEAVLRATDEIESACAGMTITVSQDLFCGDEAESV